ncbi:MAG: inositol monophosphatase family protein [Nitriliruptorales bacterium]
MSDDLGEELLDLAVRVAESAGDLLLDYVSRRDLDVETKSSATDPVSEADHAAERHITAGLLEARPDDGILGEEDAANRPGTTGVTWVIDPLDGTVNFLYAIPVWCVSIACRDAAGGLVGVVRDPDRGETFAARRGAGATLNGRPIAVNAVADLSRALIATGFSYDAEVRRVQGAWAADLLGRARDLRRGGAAALDLAWAAAGRHDAFYEFGLKPWDLAAGAVLVEEAGGRSSTREVEVAGRPGVLAAAGAPAVHDQLVAWLGELGVVVGS